MIKRRITLFIGFLLITAVLLVLVFNKPFDKAAASDQINSIDIEPPISVETNKEMAALDEPETSASLNDSETPEIITEESPEPSDLEEVRDLLKEKINTTLLRPGWVKIQKENTSFLAVEDTVVPETGQVIYQNYVLTHWFLVNEGHAFDVVFTQGKNMDGEVYYSRLLSNGKQWQAMNPEELETLDFPFLADQYYLDVIISFGESPNAKVVYLTEDGVRVVAVTTILQFPSPTAFNGWEDANVVELESIYYYNWETGSLVKAEEWITREDGARLLANLRKVTVSQVEEISDEVVQNILKQAPEN